MEQSKFQKTVWSINGVLILVTFVVILISTVVIFLDSFLRHYDRPEVIVGEELEEAKEKGLILQGLSYESPQRIHGSSGYILPVSIKTYNTPEESDYDGDSKLDLVRSPKFRIENYYNTVNVIFLDNQFRITGKLLDKKGYIESFKYPSPNSTYNDEFLDSAIRHITYLIGFQDTNKDGTLNEDDQNDLYITDLNGQGFAKVTDNIDVSSYWFPNAEQIVIEYFKREDKPDEHKHQYFARYFIKEKRFEDISQLNGTLDAMQKELTK